MTEMDFNLLIELLSQIDGIEIINSKYPNWIQFSCYSIGVIEYFQEQTEELNIDLLVLPGEPIKYQLVFEKEFTTFLKKIKNFIDSGSQNNARLNELGVPDLSFVTIRQMAIELKKRKNLCFALIWIENNERDNISIEGSGDKNQLVGLLARGLNMTIQWADKNITFKRPTDDA